jgi:hypothetical protein
MERKMTKGKPKDITLVEAIMMTDELARKGCKVYQKFTCSLCGSRQTIDLPNVFYKTCKCELCGSITNVEKQGCGIAVVGPPEVILKNLFEGGTDD